MKEKKKLTIGGIFSQIILLILAVIVLGYGMILGDIWFYGTKDEKTEADVIIVLGAAAYESGVTPVFWQSWAQASSRPTTARILIRS